MRNFWYIDASGRMLGPVSWNDLALKLQSGEILARSPVRADGADDWRTAADVLAPPEPDAGETFDANPDEPGAADDDDIPDLLADPADDPRPEPSPSCSASEQLPPRRYASNGARSQAGPWRRFLARTIDLTWEMALTRWLVSGLMLSPFVNAASSSSDPLQLLAWNMAYLFLALILDAACYSALGNTPGKMLLCLRVENTAAQELSGVGYLDRNLNLWAFGLGFGLPVVSLITQVAQWSRVRKGLFATYDRTGAYAVTGPKVSPWRWLVALAALIAALNAFAAVSHLRAPSYADVFSSPSSVSDPYKIRNDWRNPFTSRIASLPARWRASRLGGSHRFLFSSPSGKAAAYLNYAATDHDSLGDYTASLVRHLRDSTAFDVNNSAMTHVNGYPIWQADASAGGSLRAYLFVARIGHRFWRLVAIARHDGSARADIDNLAASLIASAMPGQRS